jgi:hypothetical protein
MHSSQAREIFACDREEGGSPVGRSLTCGSRARDRFGLRRASGQSHPRRAGAKACARPLPRQRTLVRARTAKSPCGCEPKACPGAGETGCRPVGRDRKWYRNDPHRRGCRAPVRCAIMEVLCGPPGIARSARRVWKERFSPGAHLPIDRCVRAGKGARALWPAVRFCAGGAASSPQIRCSAGTVALTISRSSWHRVRRKMRPALIRKAVRSASLRGTRSRKSG